MNYDNQSSCQQLVNHCGAMQQSQNYNTQYQAYPCVQVMPNTEIQKKFLEYIRINSKISDVFKTQNLIQTLEIKYNELSSRNILHISNPKISNYTFSDYIPHDICMFAEEIGRATNTDMFTCIMAICGAIAIALRGRYRIRLNAFWTEEMNLFIIIAKKSGQRKSAIVKYLKIPITDYLERKLRLLREQNKNCYNVNHSQIVTIKKAKERLIIKNYIHDIKESGEDTNSMDILLTELSHLNDEMKKYIPEDNNPAEIFCNVTTILGLLQNLKQQGETIALLEAEASFLFSRYFKENSFITLLNNAYDGESYQYNSSKNNINIHHPSLNMLLFLQTKFMVEHFANENLDSLGYLPRMLPIFASDFVDIENDPTLWGMEGIPYPSAQYSERISKILDITYTQDQDREIYDIVCEPEAYDMIKKFEASNGKDSSNNAYPHMESFISKLHGHAIRIAGAIHGWNHLEPHKQPLTVKEMEAGIYLASIVREHANIAYNTELKNARENALKILRYIVRQDWSRSNPLISSTQLLQNVGLKKSQCIPALDFLEKHNFIRQHHEACHAILCILHKDLPNINLNTLTVD